MYKREIIEKENHYEVRVLKPNIVTVLIDKEDYLKIKGKVVNVTKPSVNSRNNCSYASLIIRGIFILPIKS